MPKKTTKKIKVSERDGTKRDLSYAMMLTRQEATGITLMDIAEAVSFHLRKEELAVLINHLTQLHAKRKK